MSSKKNTEKQQPKWMIHLVANGTCDCCGKVEKPWIKFICDAHTYGLKQAYGHMEFQMIIQHSAESICSVLNGLGDRVAAGEKFEAGQFIDGVFLDCPVRLDLVDDVDEVPGLRVIIPDSQNRWPENPDCEYPYSMQTRKLNELRNLEEGKC